jgi:hypothetical protein
MLVGWRWCLALALVSVALWSHPGVARKIDRFTDKDGTLHITNKEAEEPIKLEPMAHPQAPTPLPQATQKPAPAAKTPRPQRLAPPAPGLPQSPGDSKEAAEREVQANQGGAAPPGAPPRPPHGSFNRHRMPPPQPVQ